jgi:hypothetical protein
LEEIPEIAVEILKHGDGAVRLFPGLANDQGHERERLFHDAITHQRQSG